MTTLEFIIAIISTDIISIIVTHLLTKRRYKAETNDIETNVFQKEITFLSERLEMLNKQLNEAVEKDIQNIKTIAELKKQIADLENEKLTIEEENGLHNS